jgi:hypothetical protein
VDLAQQQGGAHRWLDSVRLQALALKAGARADRPRRARTCGFGPKAATTYPPLGPSLVNESSDDVHAGTATGALPLSNKGGHKAAPTSDGRAGTNAGLSPCGATHLLIAVAVGIPSPARVG